MLTSHPVPAPQPQIAHRSAPSQPQQSCGTIWWSARGCQAARRQGSEAGAQASSNPAHPGTDVTPPPPHRDRGAEEPGSDPVLLPSQNPPSLLAEQDTPSNTTTRSWFADDMLFAACFNGDTEVTAPCTHEPSAALPALWSQQGDEDGAPWWGRPLPLAQDIAWG